MVTGIVKAMATHKLSNDRNRKSLTELSESGLFSTSFPIKIMSFGFLSLTNVPLFLSSLTTNAGTGFTTSPLSLGSISSLGNCGG